MSLLILFGVHAVQVQAPAVFYAVSETYFTPARGSPGSGVAAVRLDTQPAADRGTGNPAEAR
jgi:hypothetical protein